MDADFKLPTLRQDYAAYTPDDHAVWRILFERQMEVLPPLASRGYLEGIEKVNFTAERIPNYEETNEILRGLTGWEIFVVPGLIPNRPFFELMRDRKFCASTWLRKREQLDYLEEPDMFHDIFGHVPMLTDPNVCNFLSELARIALRHIDDEGAIELIARLYWYTIEFGLIREGEQTKIFGAGILSSKGESLYCLGPEPRRVPYDVRDILRTPYIKEHYQAQYWVLDSFGQLFGSIPDIERILEEELSSQPA
jgi:phenylalanine-4-hydroxylase